MRLAVLVSRYPTLSHTFIRREVEALRRSGVEVEVFSVRRGEGHWQPLPEDRGEEERTHYLFPIGPLRLLGAHAGWLLRRPLVWLRALVDAERQRAPGVRGFLWGLFYFAEAGVLARDLERHGSTHLHNHFANGAATVGLLAAKLLDIGWSLTLHGASDFGHEWGPLLPAKLRAARFVVCVSQFGRAQALRILAPDEWDKVFVSRCGVELERLPARAERAASPLRLLCVGRLSPEKGMAGLIEALAALATRGLDVELRIVGDGPERQALESQCHALGVADRCELVGGRSEAETLRELAEADVFVLPSLMEGLPVVLMEAMALGVPVVAPRLAGIPELVRDAENGVLFAPADWGELGRRLAQLVEHADERRRLGEAARNTVHESFAIDRAIQPLLLRLRSLGEDEAALEGSAHAAAER